MKCITLTWIFEISYADKYMCPNCSASDRERFYALFVQDHLLKKNNPGRMKLVHFALEDSLRNLLCTIGFLEYRTADLNMEDIDDQVDLTNLDMYKENYFDFYICPHMLKHIPDDIRAMRELYRIF